MRSYEPAISLQFIFSCLANRKDRKNEMLFRFFGMDFRLSKRRILKVRASNLHSRFGSLGITSLLWHRPAIRTRASE